MRLQLRKMRLARGLTQAQLAEMAGMSASYYAELERGVKPSNVNRLGALAKALECSEADLFESQTEDEAARSMTRRILALPEEQRQLVEQMLNALRGEK